MELWELSAREEIRETLARYHHAGDSGRFDDMAALFAVDGVLEIHGEDAHNGRAAIIDFLTGVNRDVRAMSDVPMLRHYSTNVTITVTSPQEATAASAFLVLTDSALDHWGRFAHRLVRTDGYAPDGWAIKRRPAD